MSKGRVIQSTIKYVKNFFAKDTSGHDWWHMWRVWQNAKLIGKTEKVDMFIVEMGALLHDISDWKFSSKKDSESGTQARQWLKQFNLDKKTVDHICNIVATVSFKGAGVTPEMKTLEGKVVRDADRLDAIGAMGIARAFAYGGFQNRLMHDPDEKPQKYTTTQDYIKNNSSTINHFYEKLLLLKNLMGTKTGKCIAEKRHEYMEKFLKEFYEEWEGKA